ncbi:MAG: aspartyl protease family protein [Cyanobacteria bacterium]|nr:aspartyl protease family protein [Cyanobacteriota bacterium]
MSKEAFPRFCEIVVISLTLNFYPFLQCVGAPNSLAQEAHRPGGNAPAAVQPAEPRRLAEQIVAAMGGLKNIKRVNSLPLRATGKIVQISPISGSQNTFNCEIIAQSNKQRISVSYMGQQVVTGYDGKTCWIQQGDIVSPTDAITAQRIKEDLDHGFLLVEKILDSQMKLKSVPVRKVNGRVCPGLEVPVAGGKPTIFFVDPVSHLVLLSEYDGYDVEQGIECKKSFQYSNYRPVEGTMQPLTAIEFSGGKKVSVLTVDAIKVQTDLNPNIFKMPQETKIASLDKGPIVIPFEYTSNEIVAKFSLNGQSPRPFIVDTGATQTIIDNKTASALGKVNPKSLAITTGSGSVDMGYLTLKSIKLGDITLSDIPVAVADLSKFAQQLKFQPAGLLGANILKRFLVTVDYDKQQLILANPDKVKVPPRATIINTKPALGVSGLSVDGVLDGKLTVPFLIDSGAAYNHVTESLIKKILTEPILPVGHIKGLDGLAVSTGAVQFESLTLGNLLIEKPVFSVAPAKTNTGGLISSGGLAIIGNPLLSRFRVTFDYRNQRMFLETTVEKEQEQKLVGELESILRTFYETHDWKDASKKLVELSTRCESSGQQKIAALALAYDGLIVSDAELKSTDDSKDQRKKKVNTRFSKAYRLAETSKSDDSMASVLSLWAYWYLKNAKDREMIDEARPLVGKALLGSSTNALALATAGLLVYRTADSGESIPSFASRTPSATLLLNQALMLDPSNWIGLWLRYKTAVDQGDHQEAQTVKRHLIRYYPEALEVKALPKSL